MSIQQLNQLVQDLYLKQLPCLQKQINSLVKFKNKSSTNVGPSEDFEELDNRVTELINTELPKIRTNISSVVNSVNQCSSDLSGVIETMTTLETDSNSHGIDISTHTAQINDLINQLQSVSSQIDSISQSINQYDTSFNNIISELSSHSSRIENCNSNVGTLIDNYNTMNQTLLTLDNTVNQYETTFHNIDTNILSHGTRLDNHDSSIGSLFGNFNTISENISSVDGNVHDLTQQINSIDSRLTNLSDKVDFITPADDGSYTPETINCFATYVNDTRYDFRDESQVQYLTYNMHVYKPTQWDKYDEERSKEEYTDDHLEITNVYINARDDNIRFQDFIVDFVAKVQERSNVIADCGLTLHIRSHGIETRPHVSEYNYMVAWLKLLEWTSRVIVYADEYTSTKVDPETLEYRKHPIGKITDGRFPISSTSRVKTIEVNNTDDTQLVSITASLVLDADNNETEVNLALEEFVFPETVRGIDVRLDVYVMYNNEQRLDYISSTDYTLSKVTSNINTLYFPTHAGHVVFVRFPLDKLEHVFFPPLADKIEFLNFESYLSAPQRIKVHREAIKADKNGNVSWVGAAQPTFVKREFPESA